jgi:hypothetical protein
MAIVKGEKLSYTIFVPYLSPPFLVHCSFSNEFGLYLELEYMDSEINEIRNISFDLLYNQYRNISSKYRVWKQLNDEHEEGTEEGRKLKELESLEEEEEFEVIQRQNWIFYGDFEYLENSVSEEQHQLEQTLFKIKTALSIHKVDQVDYLFNLAEKYCDLLEIDMQFDHDLVNNAIAIVRIKSGTTIFAPPKPDLIIPCLIIPSQSYLISLIKDHPGLIFNITPRQFEELIAEVFHARGFEVELTQPTRDGGRDIIALFETLNVRSKYLIECKRYSTTNKITLSVVQRLYGVKMAESANKAILATTSSFTRDALAFASNHIWDLDLKPYDDIMRWIKEYKYP